MKNINLKYRKTLSVVLGLVLVCVFTLTMAYAALSTVLTIQGSARVSAANWDIYLNNPVVKNGSATTNVPVIKTSSTLEFSTTLNMPGDFYEFTVDVVNGGSIDAMIENVVKNPELTSEQAKYLNYNVSYANGEAITSRQLLEKETSMPIKVRIEYRRDISNNDLPTGQVVLNLSLTLEYVQSDGNVNNVKNNGVFINPVLASGDIDTIGTIVTIGSEQFYVIGSDSSTVSLFAMYNLNVGGYRNDSGTYYAYQNPTGKQDSEMLAFVGNNKAMYGVVSFSSSTQKGPNYSDYSGSLLEKYINEYKVLLENEYGIVLNGARAISFEELCDENTFKCDTMSCRNSPYKWIYSTSYWTGTPWTETKVIRIGYDSGVFDSTYNLNSFGVRPVIIISKDYF